MHHGELERLWQVWGYWFSSRDVVGFPLFGWLWVYARFIPDNVVRCLGFVVGGHVGMLEGL